MIQGWAQIIFFLVVLTAIVPLLGGYMAKYCLALRMNVLRGGNSHFPHSPSKLTRRFAQR